MKTDQVNLAANGAGAKSVQPLLDALRAIEQMSRDARKGPAHVAKLSLSMMADVAADAIAKWEKA